jgi:hypothetical protein
MLSTTMNLLGEKQTDVKPNPDPDVKIPITPSYMHERKEMPGLRACTESSPHVIILFCVVIRWIRPRIRVVFFALAYILSRFMLSITVLRVMLRGP